MATESKLKCGMVGLVGRPNAGKSTLLNRLVGQKVAIVSDKPQTTRNRLLGVRTMGENQIVFVDTPGIHRPGYRLNDRMMDIVYEALQDVDIVVHLVDVSESYGKGEEFAVDLVGKSGKSLILALNKVDAINKGKALPVLEFYGGLSQYDELIPLSAQTGDNVEALLQALIDRLPEGEFLYPPEFLTDRNERFLVSELIREKVLRYTRQELPYSVAVKVEMVDEVQREEGFVKIFASIVVDKASQKKIVIGRGGRMIKQIGIEARQDVERLLDVRKVYLDLNVKVEAGWRNLDHLLDELGVS